MMKRNQQGVTMLVVLVLLSVMLLGGLALARMTEIGTLASGNAGYREASVQASDVGLNTAFAAIRAITDEETSIAGWYWNTPQPATGGIPNVDFGAAPSVTVGPYTASYVAERICIGLPLTDPLRQCLVKQTLPDGPSSRTAGVEKLDPVNSRQFRVTVRVQGPKGTQTWIQSLITKG